MKRRILSLSLSLAILAAFIPAAVPAASAAAFTPVKGWEMMGKIGLGINIGNTLDAWVNWETSQNYGLNTETVWGEIKIVPELFKTIADKGFEHVRIPVTWQGHMDKDYRIDKAWMDRVEQCVKWALDEDLYVILNTHHEDPLYQLMDEGNIREAERYLTGIWSQVAERFKEYSEKLIFEVMNEPHGPNWSFSRNLIDGTNLMNAAALQTIRKSGGSNDKRCVLLPTAGASIDRADDYIHPPNDDYIIASIHAYIPWNFCAPENEGGNLAVFSPAGSRTVDDFFAKLDRIFTSKGIPVVIGELGAAHKGSAEEQAKWVTHYFTQSAALGVPVTWWSVGEKSMEKGVEGWAILNRQNLAWLFPEVLDAMFAAYGKKQERNTEPAVTPGPDPEPVSGLTNFTRVQIYDNRFTDLNWSRDWVSKAYEYGIIAGTSATTFGSNDNMTTQNALVIASKIHAIYTTGSDTALTTDAVYPTTYINYALEHGIIDDRFDGRYGQDATRAELAYMWSRILPASELQGINTYAPVSDVSASHEHYDAIKLFYEAGIVSGSDTGLFNPDSPASRGDCAVMFVRLVSPSDRSITK